MGVLKVPWFTTKKNASMRTASKYNLNFRSHCYNGCVNKKSQLLLAVALLGMVDATVPFFLFLP